MKFVDLVKYVDSIVSIAHIPDYSATYLPDVFDAKAAVCRFMDDCCIKNISKLKFASDLSQVLVSDAFADNLKVEFWLVFAVSFKSNMEETIQ